MNIFLIGLTAFNLFAGWIPTESNNVDFLSLSNFAMASVLAYLAGLDSK